MNKLGRFLPEWTPVRAVLLAWPYPHGDWEANYSAITSCYWDLLTALSGTTQVWLLLHPSLDHKAFTAQMGERPIDRSRVTLLTETCYDDTWIRDYGPLSTEAGYLSFTFNGWGGKYAAIQDNRIPETLRPQLGVPVVKYPFVCEGGGLETNGEILLLNADCIVDELRNPGWDRARIEAFFTEVLGQEKFAWLEGICLSGDDTDGHIDTIARFADATTVVYSGPNPAHLDAPILDSLHRQLQALAASNGWRLLALPSPEYRSLLDGRPLPCTYANFLIVNDCVFAPIYGLRDDAIALAVLAAAFPRHRIIPVRCEALLEQHGSLHCATMQVARLA